MRLARWSAVVVGALVLTGCFPIHHPPPPPKDTIAFVSDRTGSPEIWTMRSDGSNQTQLTNSADIEDSPEISKDGSQIVFVRRNANVNVFPNEVIWVMNVDGSNQHAVFAPALPDGGNIPPSVTRDIAPTWSDDGTQIAFRRDGLGTLTGILVMDADSTDLHSVVPALPPGESDRVTGLAWSADGLEIAYAFNYSAVILDHIIILKVDGTGTRELIGPRNGIDAQTFDISPAWSPDSDRIAFSGEPNIGNGGIGGAGIWLANATGPPDLQQIVFGAGGEPSWSPDGARIAFERDGRVWTMRSDGFDQVDLTDGEDPSWGPKA